MLSVEIGLFLLQEQSAADGISDDDDIPSDVNLNDPYFKEELDKFKSILFF